MNRAHVRKEVDKLFYTRDETAELLAVSVRTLDRWREQGKGPNATLFGPRTIRYSAGDIIRWKRRIGE